MNFKKIALATAIAALPAAAFSVETLEDADLGGVTGQDGIKVGINIGTAGISTTSIYIHDKDGLNQEGLDDGLVNVSALQTLAADNAYSYDGAIVISGFSIAAGTGGNINLEIDAGDNAVSGGAAVLNIGVSLPGTLTISTGAVSVANSQIDDTPSARGVQGQTAAFLDSMDIIVTGLSLNIQLGNEAQVGSLAGSDMLVIDASLTGGLAINGFALNDLNSGGSIGSTSMTITDSGGPNLTVAADVNVTASGLSVGIGALGDAGGMSIEIVDQYLGSSGAPIGDISILGLNLNGTTITLSGKN